MILERALKKAVDLDVCAYEYDEFVVLFESVVDGRSNLDCTPRVAYEFTSKTNDGLDDDMDKDLYL